MEPNKQKSALLIMDMQARMLAMYPNSSTLCENVNKAIKYARANNIPVFFVRVGFRLGMPEISANNKVFAASKEKMAIANMDEWMSLDSSIEPLPNEIVITKRRVSAFTGSDLEVLLRAQGIQHLILTGLTTSGVVLSTTRQAADKDYLLTVLSDCCGDVDEEVHRILVTKILPPQAEVLTVAEWISR